MAVDNPFTWGTGRRKTATARVRLKAGTGKFIVNGKEFEQFFVTSDTRRQAAMPLEDVLAIAIRFFQIDLDLAGVRSFGVFIQLCTTSSPSDGCNFRHLQ